MKTLMIVLFGLATLALVLVLVLRTDERAAPGPAGESELVDGLRGLDTRLDQLARRLDALERRSSVSIEPGVERAPARDATNATAGESATAERDAAWYLEQYVRSFDDGGEGSEYFRLIVDAYVLDLVEPVAMLVVDPGQVLGLRASLVRMLGKARLRGDARVLDTLVVVLRQNGPDGLAHAALQSWSKAGDEASLQRLESLVWSFTSGDVRGRAMQVLLQIAGERSNAVLHRLLATAPDDGAAKMLIALLDSGDLDAALAVFMRASQMNQPVRLAAALRIGEYGSPPFLQFVEDWLRIETDAAVIEALGGAREQQRTIPAWAPMQATGQPNADPARDDQNAWAPREPEMGLQWLELVYATADRIHGVRIHEVCTPGAVAEVRARDTGGTWHVLWSGTSEARTGGPLEITFAPTSYRTQVLRIVLDTDRTSGWNEIDAVEMLGLGGRQWAESATASSTFAQPNRVVLEQKVNRFLGTQEALRSGPRR